MKRVTLEFDLNSDNGVFEREELQRCLKSLDLCLCIDSIRRMLINKRDKETDHDYEIIDGLIDNFFEILDEYNIDLDELVS